MKVRVLVSLKPKFRSPGRAVHHALEGLGFEGVSDVRIGRVVKLDLVDNTDDQTIDEMCSSSRKHGDRELLN